MIGIQGPPFPSCTRYRLSLNRCGSKRVPSFLPRDTLANSIGHPPKSSIPPILQTPRPASKSRICGKMCIVFHRGSAANSASYLGSSPIPAQSLYQRVRQFLQESSRGVAAYLSSQNETRILTLIEFLAREIHRRPSTIFGSHRLCWLTRFPSVALHSQNVNWISLPRGVDFQA